jgi:hypothetical protein
MQAFRQTKTDVPLRITTVLVNKQIPKILGAKKISKDLIFTPPLPKIQTLTQKRRNPRLKSKLEEMALQILVLCSSKKQKLAPIARYYAKRETLYTLV